MIKSSFSLVAAAIVFLGCAANGSASLFTGNYSYGLTGETSNVSCLTASPEGGHSWTDDFAGTGTNSISSDPVTFSICDGTPGFLEDGTFTITDGGGDSATGAFSGVLTGNTLPDNTGGDIFDGSFTITSAFGSYAATLGAQGSFEDVTGPVNTDAFATGTFDFQQTPEPVSALLAGSGFLLMGLSRKFLKQRS
jgi:hypothetical protein